MLLRRSKSPLTDHEKDLLERARAMAADEPPHPWGKRIIISAAGVAAGGWDGAENVVLISHEGDSTSDPRSGIRLMRNRDAELTFSSISADRLSFNIPDSDTQMKIFGLWGGDGTHVTDDGWNLEVIYPWWPKASAIIRTPFIIGSGRHDYLARAHMINLCG